MNLDTLRIVVMPFEELFHEVERMRTFHDGLWELIWFRFIQTQQFKIEIGYARVKPDNLLLVCFGIRNADNLWPFHCFVWPFSIIVPAYLITNHSSYQNNHSSFTLSHLNHFSSLTSFHHYRNFTSCKPECSTFLKAFAKL